MHLCLYIYIYLEAFDKVRIDNPGFSAIDDQVVDGR